MTPREIDLEISRLIDKEEPASLLAFVREAELPADYVVTYSKTREQFRLLSTAVTRRWTDLAVYLIENGADVNRKEHGVTALMDACLAKDHVTIEALLARGAKLDLKSPRGGGEADDTALMSAAEQQDAWAVKRLLQAGADPTITNYLKQSAIHYALMPRPIPGATEIVIALLDAGCPLVGTEIHFPVCRRDVEMTWLLIERGSPVDVSIPYSEYAGPKKGETPLTTAVRTQMSDITDEPAVGLFPTHALRLEITRMLLGAGADPNIPGAKGQKPLTIAIRQKTPDLEDILIAAGAEEA
jgi:ankyrin repeat protein